MNKTTRGSKASLTPIKNLRRKTALFLTLGCTSISHAQDFPPYFSPSVAIACFDTAGQETLFAKRGENSCVVRVYVPEEYREQSIKIRVFGIYEGEVNTLTEYGRVKDIAHKEFGEFFYPLKSSSLKTDYDDYSYAIPNTIYMEPFQNNIEMIKAGFSKYKMVSGMVDVTEPFILAYTGGKVSLKTIGNAVSALASIFVGEVQPTWIQASVAVCDLNGVNCSAEGTNWIPVR